MTALWRPFQEPDRRVLAACCRIAFPETGHSTVPAQDNRPPADIDALQTVVTDSEHTAMQRLAEYPQVRRQMFRLQTTKTGIVKRMDGKLPASD